MESDSHEFQHTKAHAVACAHAIAYAHWCGHAFVDRTHGQTVCETTAESSPDCLIRPAHAKRGAFSCSGRCGRRRRGHLSAAAAGGSISEENLTQGARVGVWRRVEVWLAVGEARWVGGVRAAGGTTTVKRAVYKKSSSPCFQANLDRFDGRRYPPRAPPDKCSQGDVSYSEKLPKSYCGKLPKVTAGSYQSN